jgi:hypothetical protein
MLTVLTLLLLSGCATESAHGKVSTSIPTTRYTSDVVTFTHPTSWVATISHAGTSESTNLVILSNQAWNNPCNPSATNCQGSAERQLGARGVWIQWATAGVLGTEYAGRSVTVSGRPAHELVSKPGECKDFGAQETVSLVVGSLAQGNFFTMLACLRGPDLTQLVAQVDAMVSSAAFHT